MFTYLLTEIKKREIKLYFPVLTYFLTYLLKKLQTSGMVFVCLTYLLTYLL